MIADFVLWVFNCDVELVRPKF